MSHRIVWLLGFIVSIFHASQAAGQSPRAAPGPMLPTTERAVDRGLAYLADHQNEDGSFGTGGYGRNVAVVGLAGMAFMAHGSAPNRGPYGVNVERCTAYILSQTQDSGFIIAEEAASHGPMYGHGFATLFLAEVYGMSPDPDVRDVLAKAVKLIVDTQNAEGGWRYFPQRQEADLSVTVSQVMALRAARNAGIYVPNKTIDESIEYVKRCQNPDGGFMYMLPSGPSRFPRSAAGVVALYSAGIYSGDELAEGLEYVMVHLPTVEDNRETHFYYGHYYAVQAMWHAGPPRWPLWYAGVEKWFVERQRKDGSWFDSIGPEYATAMACLILQMPNNYLPIFQR